MMMEGGGPAWGRYLVSNGGLKLNNSSLELRRRILAVCVCYRSIYTTHCVYAESTMERLSEEEEDAKQL